MKKKILSKQRRQFLKNGGLTALSLTLGLDLMFANNLNKEIKPLNLVEKYFLRLEK